MKILVVASLTAPATANYLISALRDEGHDVFVCSDVKSPLANMTAHGAVDAANICSQHGFSPELMLFIEGGTMGLFPIGLESLPCLTAWYGIDTHMDYSKHLRIGRLFDMTLVAQKEYAEKLRTDGLKQVFWLPLAFAPELHPKEPLERCYDVAYVGSDNALMHPVRHALLAAIKREIPNIFQGMANPVEMGRIYAQAKMVFNKSVNNDVNMRYFEAMGAGAVLLTDHANNNGAEELFTVGEHYLEYRDEHSLLALIKELSREPRRCREIGEAARRHVLNKHTYTHRANYLLEQAKTCTKLAKPTPDTYFAVFISLRLAEGALQMAKAAFDWGQAGRGQQWVAAVVKAGLSVLFLVTRAIEYARNLARGAK